MNRGIQRFFQLMTIAWLVVIFYFSAQPADESTERSLAIGRAVGHVFVAEYDDWSQEEQTAFAEKIDHPIRKTAHATEYAVLAILLYVSIGKKSGFPAWLGATVYAMTDEFHQRFVPGRSGQISDVVLDSLGVAAGIAIFLVVRTLFLHIRRKFKTDL